jgi:hypothetical protein
MNYQKQVDAVIDAYVKKIGDDWDGDKDDLRKYLIAFSKDVGRIVRDGTLKFYEEREAQEIHSNAVNNFPLFKELIRTGKIKLEPPPPPPDAPPEIK